MGAQTGASLSRVIPLWPLVLLFFDPTDGLSSCSTREKEIGGVKLLVQSPGARFWSLQKAEQGGIWDLSWE